MITLELVKEKKQGYLRAGESALQRATDFLHALCENWDGDCEQAFRELVDQAARCLAKASAMEELLSAAGGGAGEGVV